MATYKYCDSVEHGRGDDTTFVVAVAQVRVRYSETEKGMKTIRTANTLDSCQEHLGEQLAESFRLHSRRPGFCDITIERLTPGEKETE